MFHCRNRSIVGLRCVGVDAIHKLPGGVWVGIFVCMWVQGCVELLKGVYAEMSLRVFGNEQQCSS